MSNINLEHSSPIIGDTCNLRKTITMMVAGTIIIPLVALNPYFIVLSEDIDILFGSFVAALSLVIALYSVLSGRQEKNSFRVFFGLGMFVVVISALLEVSVSIFNLHAVSEPYHIPHLISNVSLVTTFLIISVYVMDKNLQKKFLYIIVIFLYFFSIISNIIFNFTALQYSFADNSIPYNYFDVIIGIISILGLVYYLKKITINTLYKRGIMWFFYIHMIASFVMFTSNTAFDVAFTVSHIITMFGYGIMMFFIIQTVTQSYDFQKKLTYQSKIASDIQKETASKFARLHEFSPIGYVSISLDGTIIDCNKEFSRELGYTKSELVGTSVSQYAVHKNEPSFLTDNFNGTILEDVEIPLQRKNGTIFYSLIDTLSIENRAREQSGILLAVKNIQTIADTRESIRQKKILSDTQLRDLQHVSKLKDEFSSMITHELKTPLVPIIGYCELFQDDPEFSKNLTPAQNSAIFEIHDSAIHLLGLIQNILDLNKLELGKIKLNLEKIYLRSFVEILLKTYRDISNNSVDFTINCPEKLEINIDKFRLRQILDNLLQNAIRYVPSEGGKIIVSIEPVDHHVKFSVENNGPGIPKNKQSYIFTKFYQVDTSTTRNSGSGLGLAICRGLVERMGGKVWVESDGVKDVKFCFTISKNLTDDALSSPDKDAKNNLLLRRIHADSK